MLAEEGCRQRGWCVEREELWRGWVSFAGGGVVGEKMGGDAGGGGVVLQESFCCNCLVFRGMCLRCRALSDNEIVHNIRP